MPRDANKYYIYVPVLRDENKEERLQAAKEIFSNHNAHWEHVDTELSNNEKDPDYFVFTIPIQL